MEPEGKMTNAKLLIELPGVEAGSKECGECGLESGHNTFDCDAVYCPAFRDEHRERTGSGKFLRCPACLAAEEAAGQNDRQFIDHIKAHLRIGQEVVCKICGKTAREICHPKKGRPS